MQQVIFDIARINDRDTIIATGVDLQIRIYDLSNEQFQPDPDMLQFYALLDGSYFAFETPFDQASLPDISTALAWYARYAGNPDLKYQVEDPRSYPKMRII